MELYGFYIPHDAVLVFPDDDAGEMITKQSMAAECDINNILSQFSRTGIIEHINNSPARWLDLPANMDLQEAMRVVEDANSAFSTLPSVVREAYHNDPGEFLAALADPAERDRLTKWGVFKASAAPSPGAPAAAPGGSASPPPGDGVL